MSKLTYIQNPETGRIHTMSLAAEDWPREEAEFEAAHTLEIASDYSKDETHQHIIKLRNHWLHVFGRDEQGIKDMNRFTEVFNAKCFETLGFAL